MACTKFATRHYLNTMHRSTFVRLPFQELLHYFPLSDDLPRDAMINGGVNDRIPNIILLAALPALICHSTLEKVALSLSASHVC